MNSMSKVPMVATSSKLQRESVKSLLEEIVRNLVPKYFDEFLGLITEPEEVEESWRRYSVLAVLNLTGGTEEVLKTIAELQRPLLLIYHTKYNSLPAVLEALPYLRRVLSSRILTYRYGDPGLEDLSQVCRTYAHLRGLRILLIGDVAPWLISSRPVPEVLRELGVEIVRACPEELAREMGKVSPREPPPELVSATPLELRDSLPKIYRMYLALQQLVQRYQASAVAIQCFDLIHELRCTPCLALALLNDEHVVAACEGDVLSCLTMKMLVDLGGRPCFMANPVEVTNEYVVLAHCTVPLTLVEKYRITTHFESRKPLAIAGTFKRGLEVTLVRFSEDLRRVRIMGGVVEESGPWSTELCRTHVRIRVKSGLRILEDPLGNHYVLAVGDLVLRIRYLAQLLGAVPEVTTPS